LRLPALAALVIAVAALSASAAWPSAARADGDPASDVLVTQPLFLSADAGLTSRQQAELAALLRAARREGFALRVAIIASPADLGSITELWHQPNNYVRLLGQELSRVYRGTLLVVMPNGFGLYGPARGSSALSAARSGAPGPALGQAAISAVGRLAAAAGHPLHVGAIPLQSTPSQTDFWAALALAVGAVLIALAWVASIRARPLRSPRSPSTR
jgi:hypothetical protein